MTRSCRLLLGLTVCALGLPSIPQAAPPEETEGERVRRLIRQLGSDEFAEREAATRLLDVFGPAALDALRQAAQSPDEEVSRRARELVRKIEQRLQTAKLLEPKRVRLVFEDTPLPNAVAEFAAKTGYPLQLEGDLAKLGHRKITLDTGLTTFWEATALFCRQAGLVERNPTPLQITTEERWGSRRVIAQELTRGYASFSKPNHSLILMEGQPPALPTFQAGALRIRALPPERQAADQTKGEAETLLALEVRPEPGITWQGVVNTRITKAIDDRGQELKPIGKSVTQDFKLTYELSSEPVKLVYSERRAVVIEVPFTLTNVPLAP